MISYKPLFETLKKKQLTTYDLAYKMGFSKSLINNLKHNKSITINTLEKICVALDCKPWEVFEFIEEDKV